MFSKLCVVVALILISLAMHQQYVNAIRCWNCLSNESSEAFCKDPFDENAISADKKRSVYIECGSGYIDTNPDHHPVCKKAILLVNNKTVVARSCTWVDQNAGKTDCSNQHELHPPYIKTTFCETCDTDGCNKF